MGRDATRFPLRQNRDGLDEQRQSCQHQKPGQIRFWGGHVARQRTPWLAHWRRQFLFVQARHAGPTAGAPQFIQWVTAPARAAHWSIATGYIAVRNDAWETPEMKEYLAEFPAGAVARAQLASATPELSTHRNQRVTQALNKGLRDALTGAKTPAQALGDAQTEAAAILRPYQR